MVRIHEGGQGFAIDPNDGSISKIYLGGSWFEPAYRQAGPCRRIQEAVDERQNDTYSCFGVLIYQQRDEEEKKAMCIVIPFDGVSGSGKSTLARILAGSIGYVHLNTGALYRAITAFMHTRNLSIEEVDGALREHIEVVDGRFYVGRMDTTPLHHIQEVETLVAHVSCIPRVRAKVEEVQGELIHLSSGVVLEGRNIAKRFPDTPLKFFVTASLEERARRRVERNTREFGWSAPFEEILAQLRQRDDQDMNREFGRLVPAKDAITIDTTGRTVADTSREVLGYYDRACRHTLIREAV